MSRLQRETLIRKANEAELELMPEINIPTENGGSSSGSSLKTYVAKVVENATGGGYYKCLLQKQNSDKWDTSQTEQFDDSTVYPDWDDASTFVTDAIVAYTIPVDPEEEEPEENEEKYYKSLKDANLNHIPTDTGWWEETEITGVVLNLSENGTALHTLEVDTVFLCWKFQDSEGLTRYIGTIGGGESGLLEAITKESAETACLDEENMDKLSVQLVDSTGEGVGDSFDVTCNFVDGATRIDQCFPLIKSGKTVFIQQIRSTWYLIHPSLGFLKNTNSDDY